MVAERPLKSLEPADGSWIDILTAAITMNNETKDIKQMDKPLTIFLAYIDCIMRGI